ncbi:MAG: MmgE/PrpD family protein [Roseovarius sp.]|nr:MmgE/PrpD family protein [Roseovarius sp.]
MQETIAKRLVEFNCDLTFERLPAETVSKAKRLMLDTLGICIGSTQLDFGRETMKLVAGWGGCPESTIIGGDGRSSAHYAAFCNGVLAHGQDYDDTHTESVVHPSAALVPVALAIGERAGQSGAAVLTNLIGGLETTIRLGLPARNLFHLRGFHTTSVCATFASAIMAARGRALSRRQALDAIGLGGSFTSGLLECVPARSTGKRLHAGWAGLCGIVAADLARTGFTGPETVFEGGLGVYASFLRGETLNLAEIFDRLGDRWDMMDIAPKLYPCCHYLQAFLDCVAALRDKFDILPDAVDRIHCRITAGAVNMICKTWAEKLDPKTGYDMRFSLPFAVSVMLVRGRAGVSEFQPAILEDPTIRATMSKVSYTVEPEFAVKDMPGAVEITLSDSSTRTWEIPRVRGDSMNPITDEELLTKFRANTAVLGRGASDRLADAILSLEKPGRLDDVMRALRTCRRTTEPETAAL